MKTFLTFCILHGSLISFAQQSSDSLGTNEVGPLPDNLKNSTDTSDKRPRNAYGDLLNDDPDDNRRHSIGLVMARVASSNIFGWAYSR